VISGLIVSAVLAVALLPRWTADMLESGLVRENYRGRILAFPTGALLVSVSLIALAPLAVLDDRADLDLLEPDLTRWAAYVIGVAFLGLLDDMLGRGSAADTPRGWRGHARAVASGRLSTGAIKAAGAFGLAAFAVSGLGQEWPGYLVDLALLLLTTNLFNLLDLRPGRSAKALLLVAVGVTLATWDTAGVETVALFLGPALVLGWYDLRERAMLGDTGSNLLGALAGFLLVVSLGTTAQAVALVLVLVATVYGELRSITALVERTPGLRQLDSIGRPA
jgi:UDP-GlcNAc:undecaprenyl-phosphate/decaprenyl-phosphate GlcNAc-1-phosphate transferase